MVLGPALRIACLGSSLLLGGCTYDYATGYAPEYPAGYDSGMGSGLISQPGDRFGGQNVVSIAVFDAPLAPFGQWVDSSFGRAFRPDAPEGWRPYVNGRWGENRLWVSDDPWGWATDHYGRWGFDQRIGWVWVPGTEWAPSWVAFRDDPEQNVAGWAPVPPGVNYSLNVGFGGGWGFDNFNSWYGPSWIWVPRPFLYQPGFGGRVLPWSYGASYWGGSRWQYQPGWGGRPRVQGYGYPPGRGGNWAGYGEGRRNDGYREARGRRPAQVAVPDRDGFIPYQGDPNLALERQGQPILNNSMGLPRGERPARADRQQYVERIASEPRAQRAPPVERAERMPRMERAESPQRAAPVATNSRNGYDGTYDRPD